ncbi:MAG: ABC transporter permease, partial [Lautropia sp.]
LPLMYNDAGVIVATLHVYLTFLVLPLYASLQAIDPRVEESAASLGASPLAVFWRITFPLSVPGLVAGASLVFILTMGLYLTPTIMGGSFVVTVSMLITELARNQYNWPAASALSIILLATMGLTLLAAFATRKWMKLQH